jgi:hypothetical protein
MLPPLQDIFSAAQTALPRAPWVLLMRTTLRAISALYLHLFSPDGIAGCVQLLT